MKNKLKIKTTNVAQLSALIKSIDTVQVPWEVWTCFGPNSRTVSVGLEGQICLGEDFKSLEECRKAVGWYVEQLGGSVTWK